MRPPLVSDDATVVCKAIPCLILILCPARTCLEREKDMPVGTLPHDGCA